MTNTYISSTTSGESHMLNFYPQLIHLQYDFTNILKSSPLFVPHQMTSSTEANLLWLPPRGYHLPIHSPFKFMRYFLKHFPTRAARPPDHLVQYFQQPNFTRSRRTEVAMKHAIFCIFSLLFCYKCWNKSPCCNLSAVQPSVTEVGWSGRPIRPLQCKKISGTCDSTSTTFRLFFVLFCLMLMFH